MMQHRFSARARAFIGLGLGLTLALGLLAPAKADTLFNQVNLVTDDQSVNPAFITDPYLVNAWGISRSANSPFWVSDNGMTPPSVDGRSGFSTVYRVTASNGVSKVIIGSPRDASGGVVIPPPG